MHFEGSANFPGEFRGAMILLAQQISSPQRPRWVERICFRLDAVKA